MAQDISDRPVDLKASPRQSSRVVSRIVSGEHILVPLASRGADIDSIYNLNSTGTFIWEKIDGKNTGAEIAEMVAAEFLVSKEQAKVDCLEFLSQLLEVRAIEFNADKGKE
ncbi:MAG: PqqD family protein [Vicinamibacteria bacterium]